MNKILKRSLIGLAGASVLAVGGVYAVFGQDIKSINSIELVDDYGLYQMTIYGDYGLDKLVEQGGASTDQELVEFNINHLLKGLPVEFNIPDFGCSTFQAVTPEGDWLMGRNYDLDYAPGMLVATNPENGYRSISVANIAILGYNEDNLPTNFKDSFMNLAAPYLPMDGMNEKGLSIGVLLIRDDVTKQESDKVDMTTTSMIRYVLDKAATVQEAIELFESVDMNSSAGASYHFQLADANGDSALIEYVDHELHITRKGQTDKPMALTNFIVADANYGFGHGHDRYEIVTTALEKANGVLTEEEAMDVLQSVSVKNYVELTGEGSDTQWSVVYNNTDLTLNIVAGGNFDVVHTFAPFE